MAPRKNQPFSRSTDLLHQLKTVYKGIVSFGHCLTCQKPRNALFHHSSFRVFATQMTKRLLSN